MLVVTAAAVTPGEVTTGGQYLISIAVSEVDTTWQALCDELAGWQGLIDHYSTWKQVKQR